MGSFRKRRAIDASIIDALTANFTADWSGISVVKSFEQVTRTTPLPVVCVLSGGATHEFDELGSTITKRSQNVFIHVFATGLDQLQDLLDYIITKVRGGFIYYDYVTTTSGRTTTVTTKTANGRIRILSIDDEILDIETDKSNQPTIDRFRGLITLRVTLSKVES